MGHWPVRGEEMVDWGSPVGEPVRWEDLPPSKQPSLFGEAWTLEKPTFCRESRALTVKPVGWRPLPRFLQPPSCRGQRRRSPSPAPSFSPGPGPFVWRRDPSAFVYLHAPAVPALVAHASSRIPKQPREITNRDLAPKKKKPLAGEAGPMGSEGGASRWAGSWAFAFACCCLL